MLIKDLLGKKILIAGYGMEGKSTEKFLKKFIPNLNYEITDFKNDKDYLVKQTQFDLVIKTPGIQRKKITVPYTTATNLFFANVNKMHSVIGVTGSKGKSTTASLIFHILKENGINARLIGNIGKPMLEELINEPQDKTVYVVELSSYQLEDLNYSPHISVLVSLFPEHLNYHENLKTYYNAKKRIFKYATQKDYVVFNSDFKEFDKWLKNSLAKAIPFDKNIVINSSPLIGEHNMRNLQGAITACRILGVKDEDALKFVKTFKPLPHRLQNVGTFNEINFYDDAISTTPESTIEAIKTLPKVQTIFLGGEDRDYDFTVLANLVVSKKIPQVVLFPDTGKYIKKSLLKAGFVGDIFETKSMEEAVIFAYKSTKPGNICLLSTASPSYSIWKNYEEKGNEFVRYVLKYAPIKK